MKLDKHIWPDILHIRQELKKNKGNMQKNLEASDIIHREISWLSFNGRVLQEAENLNNPPIERLKFLGIFSSNLDEFYRIRVANLRRFMRMDNPQKLVGFNPELLLKKITSIALKQQKKFASIYQQIHQELGAHQVFIVNETQLSQTQISYVKNFFEEEIQPHLFPMMIDKIEKFPYLKDHSIYLAVKLSKGDSLSKPKHALLEIPTDSVSRFVILPKENNATYIMLIDDVIRLCLKKLFYFFEEDVFDAWTIKLTRDAELDIDQDIEGSIVERVQESLKTRKKGTPVRFLFDSTIDTEYLNYIVHRMHLDPKDLVPGDRYHNFKDFINFPHLPIPQLHYPTFEPLEHKNIEDEKSIFTQISQQDLLVHTPYHSFEYILRFLREASIDPKVKSIHITLYRLAKNSKVVNALINAVKNGKEVTAVLELQARFDEEANINWAKVMEDEGVKVLYGSPGIKIHTKMCLVIREEKNTNHLYALLGTGNFHEGNSKIYVDHWLFTTEKKLTKEVLQLFNFIEHKKSTPYFKHLLVAPLNLRHFVTAHIKKEIKHAKNGKEGYIFLKLNHLVDEQIISLLKEAVEVGVKVDLIVRTTNSFKINGHKKNLFAISIVGRLLEHSRVYIFGTGSHQKVFITSADLMSRNLDYRFEIAIPIHQENLKNEIIELMQLQLKDNSKARLLIGDQSNQMVKKTEVTTHNAQIDSYYFLS